jgi:hypothetical protein
MTTHLKNTIIALEPVYRPTKAESAAIQKGEAEIARGGRSKARKTDTGVRPTSTTY